MDKLEYLVVIIFFLLFSSSPIELKLGRESDPPFTTFKKWAIELKRDCISLEDDSREGLSKTATTEENIKKVANEIPNNLQLMVYEIDKNEGISTERARYI